MADYTFKYDDPETLNRLVNYITEQNACFSAMLKPVALLDAIKVSRATVYDDSFVRKVSRETGIDLSEREEVLLYELGRSLELNIWPFSQFEVRNNGFDGRIERRSGTYVEIPGHGPISDLIRHAYADPRHIALGRKFSQIWFEDIGERKGEEGALNVARAKEAIGLFVEQSYIVTQISGMLNPRSVTRDHYYDSVECDASFRAYGDGEIVFRGADDHLGEKVQQFFERQKLPGQQLLLPCLI